MIILNHLSVCAPGFVMENIDALDFLQPLVTIGFSAGLVIYWHLMFTALAFLCSLFAYGGAIACKVILQPVTFNSLMAVSVDLLQNSIVALVLFPWLEEVTDYSESRLASEVPNLFHRKETDAGTINVYLKMGISCCFVP